MRVARNVMWCRQPAPDRARTGFSLIELVVVMGIMGLLVALLLPAVQQSRETARRVQCLSQMRQIGMALVTHEEQTKRFPALGNYSATGPEIYHSWVVAILPGIDQGVIYNQWDFDQPHDDVVNSSNGQLARTPLPILACPSDVTAAAGQANQSYVVNAGIGWTEPVDCPFTISSISGGGIARVRIDLSGDGIACPSTVGQEADRRLLKALGLFFAENWPAGSGTVRHHSFTSITDGASNTLMLAENVRAGFDPAFNTTWASADVERQSFIISGHACENFSCAPGGVNYARTNDRSTVPWSLQAINSSLTQPEGEAPWPSSYHQGGVNVAFCDGRARFLSENVSGEVYAAIVSPQGASLTAALKQQIVSGSEF
jgi:prepilin-type N-terminal cleavage/methylation domain-containing protein/prepilin-type processing-associated H-X9-DG protein